MNEIADWEAAWARELSAALADLRERLEQAGRSSDDAAPAPAADAPPTPMPEHDDAETEIEALLRNVLSIACLSETVAVALIGAERLEMPNGELRDLLTRIWADEIGHARFGWRLLARLAPTLDDATKDRLGDYLRHRCVVSRHW